MTTAFNIEVVFKSKLKSTLVVYIKYVNVYILNAQFHHMNILNKCRNNEGDVQQCRDVRTLKSSMATLYFKIEG